MAFFDPKFRKFRLGLFGLVGVGLLLGIILVGWVSMNLPNMEALDNKEADLSTVVYSRDGKILGNYYHNQNRILIGLDQIPDHLKSALIATEDYRFYSHSGVDLIGMLRAAASLMRQGGSTLTMQLARNLYDEEVGQERSIARKAKEMVAAAFLERSYTKEEILMHYLNTVPFGGLRYGVQSAARYYFGKNADQLKAEESALLVGILKGPTYYNPYRHAERAKNRRNTVLEQMVKYDFLDKAKADSLKKLPLGVRSTPGSDHNEGLAPYFRTHLQKWLLDWCKKEGYDLYTDGLKVYTTLDYRLQDYAEKAVRQHLSEYQPIFDKHIQGKEPWKQYPDIITRGMRRSWRWNMHLGQGMSEAQILKEFDKPIEMTIFSWDRGPIDTLMSPKDSVIYYAKFMETGVVTIEPKTGQILAWVGGPDHQYFQYDHVVQGRRQVGSTFKPFVYAAAFDNNYSPCHEISNMPFSMLTEDNQLWEPKNADQKYTPCIQLRKALAMSVNVPTARLMQIVGPRTVVEYAKKMGIQTPLEIVHALALGATDLQTLEMASAYATFANKGIWMEPHFITRIEDRKGNVLFQHTPNSREALSEETSYLMIDMLRAVINSGTGASLRYKFGLDYTVDIGGKTGTTNSHADGWFVGFTPKYCTAVWVGHADRQVRFRTLEYGQGARMALPIWGYYMAQAYKDESLGSTREQFKAPAKLRVQTDCKLFRQMNPDKVCADSSASNSSYSKWGDEF